MKAIGLTLLAAIAWLVAGSVSPTLANPPAPATFVGAAACAGCHAAETQAWHGSQHDQAMQEATAATVLGDFADATFTHFGVTSRFYRRGEGFFVETDGPDGAPQEYRVEYTFGVYPLQQYLIAFPGGRYQALSIAWDSRPEAQGGQRWFHLYPDEAIPHGDELHWTGINQNWNYMCADCHSTSLRRGYDLATDSYHTAWSALNVSCEACHGAGSAHVAWANGGAGTASDASKGLSVLLRDRGAGEWAFPDGAPIARRKTPLRTRTETEVCAPCHARRSPLRDGAEIGQPLLDGYRPALLDPGVYHADGQIDGEVYIHGSFLQSRMYRAGVTCSNCHEPHSLKLRAEGNAVCGQCHLPATFDTAAHHFHEAGQPGSRCVDCHMPAKTYMVVDPRHDHGFRVPRPDLDAVTGAPDACTACHTGEEASWAAARIAEWYGPERRREPQFGEALAAARAGTPEAGLRLARIADNPAAPGIARATAVAALEQHLDEPAFNAIRRGLGNVDPLIRLAAVGTLGSLDPRMRLEVGLPLLADPVRAVRLEAARVLAPAPPDSLTAEQRVALDRGFAEYEAAQKALLDRPEGLLTLANFYRDRGRLGEAEVIYGDALRLHPWFVPTYANLADLLRQQGRDGEGERILQQGLAAAPGSAELTHANGLLLIRRQRYDDAVAALGKAAALAPDNGRYAYVYAIALQETGKPAEAAAVLEQAHGRHPNDPDILYALATVWLQQGDRDAARRYAEQLVRLAPDYPNARELLQAVGAKAG